MYTINSSTQMNTKSCHLNGALRQFAADENLKSVAAKAEISSAQILRNKLCLEQPHKLSVVELVAITRSSGNRCIIDGVLLDLDCAVSVSLVELGSASQHELTDRALDITVNAAQLGALALDVKTTKRITERMRHETVRRATYVMEELAIFVHDVEQKFQAIPVLTVASDALQTMPMPGLM
ncbi:hypothetical protein GCM10007978_05250 [Shewanella hanedai]|uniref:Uncharacterized protein n=1 Tax=Shewanella hanedai TaxID=25 RepID=A0A553JTP2_SHEHA|nr:phage regulatory CII family protein [Shewanella hanedai]TRY15824.1 hypothetical protein FN961_02240 [Shewanella hanedai]GGI70246.1 hypothetical protein GCM10007978_05250 [Shewanella hanedai]